jgi:hypothetical protein
MKILFPVVFTFVLALLSACNSPVVVESKWTDAEIPCDADTSRWKNLMQNPDDPQFGIGVQNDGRFVYVRMMSWKREVNAQLLRFGFTTWFTGPSKKGKRFGIHFPLGIKRNAAGWHADREGGNDPEEAKARMEEALQEMELLGPGKDDSVPVKTRVAESFGIVVRMFPTDENLVYEMKVPLRQDSLCKYAIDIGPDTVIKMTFETDVPDMSEHGRGYGGRDAASIASGGRGNYGGGGHGGQGMHGGGGEGGRERSSADEMPEPFITSFSLRLAGRPAK